MVQNTAVNIYLRKKNLSRKDANVIRRVDMHLSRAFFSKLGLSSSMHTAFIEVSDMEFANAVVNASIATKKISVIKFLFPAGAFQS